MQTSEGGGTGKLPNRFEENDARRTEQTPVYKTEDFKKTVQQIKAGQTLEPQDHAPVQFNIPKPSQFAAYNNAKAHRNNSFDQAKYDKFLHDDVKQQVIKDMGNPGPGISKAQFDAVIEKRTQSLVDTIKKPRYVFLSDGTPFFLNKDDERAQLEKSLLGQPPVTRTWTLAKYDLANAVGKVSSLFSMGATKAQEFINDTGNGNVTGAALQFGFNSTLLGWEYLRGAVQYHNENRTKGEIQQLQQQAEAVKYTDPAKAQQYLDTANTLQGKLSAQETTAHRLAVASQAVQNSWDNLVGAWNYTNESVKKNYVPGKRDPLTGEIMTPLEQAVQAQKEQEQQAAKDAVNLRTQAAQAYGNGDFQKAIDYVEKAQEADRNSSEIDPYGAYTWSREPEKYQAFKKDAALLELQKGTPLTPEEIRRLKDYHTNSWTEMTGQMVFDPINLVPAEVLEKVISVPIKGIGAANKAVAEAFPAYAKTLDVLGAPARWLFRESVNSGGNRIARQTYNIMERISNGYLPGTAEDVTKAMDHISGVVLDAKRATNEAEARAIFEQGRQSIPGLQQITFRDFKQLMDAGEHIDPTQWSKIYSDALTTAEDNLAKVVAKTGKSEAEVISDVSKNRWALQEYADQFSKAFVDPHRIFKGSRLTDDTIAGWITKTMRELSGDEINDALKLNKFDEMVLANGKKLGLTTKTLLKSSTHFLESSLGFAAKIRDVWAMIVLTTPRWPINNLADSTMRDVVYGGNLWDDMVTLFTSTQRTLADELGFTPIEFNQALSRQGLEFTDTVPHRLLYQGWKPKFGVFSYIGYEYERLFTEAGDKAINKADILSRMVEKMPDSAFKNHLTGILDGWNYHVNLLTGLRAIGGGVSDFNTALEFTLRLRMFHREYFKLLEKLEPGFAERGMEALNPATKEIAKQIWQAAEGNPRRMTAYVDNLIGGAKNTPAMWSFVVPPHMNELLGGMDAADQQLFMHSVKNELDQFVETAVRNGKELKPEDFTKFFEDYKTKMQDEIQARLSAAHDFRDLDVGIKTDGKPNPVPTEADIKGSMPIPSKETPHNQEVQQAIDKLNRKNKRIKPVDITKNLETAVSDYAKVERVAGDGVRVVKGADGALTVQVGDNALKQGATKFYNNINEAVIGIFKNQDTDLIKATFDNVDNYDQAIRKFLANPTDVLSENENYFLTLVNQMENHPQLRQIIEQTSPKTVLSYDSAMDVYREIGEYSNEFGFSKPIKELYESEAERLRARPGAYIAAQTHNSVITRQVAELGRSLDPELGDRVREFVDNYIAYRRELDQFYSFTYPGPLMKATTDATRKSGWDLYYRLGEQQFLKETEAKTKMLELIQKSPDEAKKLLDEINGDFATYFLKRNGIEVEWDADRNVILNMKVQGLDGRARNFAAGPDVTMLQETFFTPTAKKRILENSPLRINTEDAASIKHQMTLYLRTTFQTDTAHADAWAKVIDAHAQKWAQETGQPIEKYYERLGFQKIDSASAKGIAPMQDVRIVKRGAISRGPDGSFKFFGLSNSNFESMVRETGELFFDDLASMAEHSPQAADDLANLKQFIEDKTGKKIHGNKLQKVHSDVMTDLFSSYVATGHGPSISVKGGFDRMKAWLTQTFDAVRDTKIAGEINDDTYRILDRMFTESKMNDVPKTNARVIRQMAKDANLVTDDEDTLLKIINDAIGQPVMDEAQKATHQELLDALKSANEEYQAAVTEAAGLAGDNAMANATIGNTPAVDAAEQKVIAAQDAYDKFSATLTKNGSTYETLGDVPKDVAARVLGTPEKPLESNAMNELQQAWDVWKTKRGLTGFPEDALQSADTFKAYLKQRMGEEWSEVGNYYNRLNWEVEQFENAMLNYHTGSDLESVVFPRVHEANISNGMKTFIRNQQQMVGNYEIARRALDEWGKYMADLAKNGHPAQLLTKEEQGLLKAWAYGDGSKAKAEMVDTILHGSNDVEGAINKVNRVMLDYQHTNNFDQMMKNFFPFWMFPSRSFPFWAETLATHPQLIAGYEKLQELSRSQRYQAGAVTSQGKPLPSLDGYIKLPGTDLWFNPLAPLSFRYLLDVQQSKDDVIYQAQSADDIDPKAYIANEMLNMSQVYGFSVSPWAAWFIKDKFGIPDEVMPRYPLIPEIQLIPRWWTQEQVQRLNKMNLFGWDWQGLQDKVYPEVPWHDYMVERKILENALQQIQSGKLSEADKLKLMNQAQDAIKYKSSDLWQQTYKDVTNDEAVRSQSSFFTGFYAKGFGDGEADLLALRNDLNKLKSALNNEFQANVFDLPVNADTGWQNYLKKQESPEGWVMRLYTDIGWVKNDEGQLIRDPQERAKWLATKIGQDEDQQIYYQKMSDLQNELNKRLRALPIGTSWDQQKIVFDWYANERSKLDYLRTFEKLYGSNKPVELIQQDMANDWFATIKQTQPRWDIQGGEKYQDYQQRVLDWESNLPKIAQTYLPAYLRQRNLVMTINALHPDQQFNVGEFYQNLVAQTNKDGMTAYDKQNDDLFTAMNKAWKNLYWDNYWHNVIGKDGYEVDLAEKDFYNTHPTPPTSDQIYQWISQYYGPDKFSPAEIKKYVDGTDELDIMTRQLQSQANPDDYQKRQDIWNLLSWLGPGGKNRDVFNTAYANAGGDPDWLTTWYQENGKAYQATNPERLDQLHNAIQTAINTLGLKPPSREELVRFVQAQHENNTFTQLVSDELGNQFFDYTDENGMKQQGVYSYYNSLSKAAKKEFRRNYRDEYNTIQDYYKMKDQFAKDHPTWADYYGLDAEPSVSLPTQSNGSVLTPPTLQGYHSKTKSSGGGGGKAQYKPMQSSYGNFPSFNIYDRTSNYISPGLYQLVGSKMAYEITNLYSSGKKISAAGVSFLKSVASRYPNYRSEIDNILAKGT